MKGPARVRLSLLRGQIRLLTDLQLKSRVVHPTAWDALINQAQMA